MSKEIYSGTVTELSKDGKFHNITTKAGRLTIELASEKRDLLRSWRNCKVSMMTSNLLLLLVQ